MILLEILSIENIVLILLFGILRIMCLLGIGYWDYWENQVLIILRVLGLLRILRVLGVLRILRVLGVLRILRLLGNWVLRLLGILIMEK